MVGASTGMKIRSLTLKNYRGFEEATLDLDRPLTVLFGVNGSGKSSVLMACACALSPIFVEPLRFLAAPNAQEMWQHHPDDTDVRRDAANLVLTASVSNGDERREVMVRHLDVQRDPSVMDIGLVRLHGAAVALSMLYEASRHITTTTDAFSSHGNGSGMAPE